MAPVPSRPSQSWEAAQLCFYAAKLTNFQVLPSTRVQGLDPHRGKYHLACWGFWLSNCCLFKAVLSHLASTDEVFAGKAAIWNNISGKTFKVASQGCSGEKAIGV